MQIRWKIGKPYIHRPFHDGLPTAEDWKRLLIAGFILAVGLSHYSVIGCNQGWRPGIREFTNAAWPELKYDWRNG